jgi:hypothetical protein
MAYYYYTPIWEFNLAIFFVPETFYTPSERKTKWGLGGIASLQQTIQSNKQDK